MKGFGRGIGIATLLLFVVGLGSGCSFVFHRRSPSDARQIDQLSSEVSKLNVELDELSAIKRDLEQRLRGEIGRGEVGLSVGDRGLVVTFVSEVLFDSGKAEIRDEGTEVLEKISGILQKSAHSRQIAVEGHTDNEPIKHSRWKSNWELSTGRSTSVVHYLVDKGISPKQLQASGFGEHRPIASNKSAEGRQRNRRVEIVILPKRAPAKPTTNFTGKIQSGTIK